MDRDHDPTPDPGGHGSDFERFRRERHRYAEAMREARRLKRAGGAIEEGDPGSEGEHPWLLASRRAKGRSGTESSIGAPAREAVTYRPWAAAAVLIACLALTAYGVTRLGAPARGVAAPGDARPVMYVWHALDGSELSLLEQLAASYAPGEIGVVLAHHDHVESAVRLGLWAGEIPDVVILSEAEALSLAGLGILEPLVDASGDERLFVPLVKRAPWSTPLVAAVLRRDIEPKIDEVRQGFVYRLQEFLEASHL